MDEVELEKRFGLAKDYYKGFLEMSDEELRIFVANLARDTSLEKHIKKPKAHTPPMIESGYIPL